MASFGKKLRFPDLWHFRIVPNLKLLISKFYGKLGTINFLGKFFIYSSIKLQIWIFQTKFVIFRSTPISFVQHFMVPKNSAKKFTYSWYDDTMTGLFPGVGGGPYFFLFKNSSLEIYKIN